MGHHKWRPYKPLICGLLISTCIMGANYTNDPIWIMTLMAIAFFGNGFASITWSLVFSLAPVLVYISAVALITAR